MKYQPPFGSTNPNAPYVDRNTPGATKGSAVPAAAIEDPQRELAAVITAAGLTPSENDLQQLAKAIQSGKLNFAIAAGSANALTANLPLVPASLTSIVGAPINILTGAAANTNAMSLNLNGLGTRSILHRDGSAISPGEVPGSSILSVIYDGDAYIAYTVALPAVGLNFANQADAEGGTENTKPMTSLRVDQQRQQARDTLASASTTDLASVTSQDIRITGTTAINSLGTGRAGLCRRLIFAGALTLNHSTALFLPNNTQDIVTKAGDTCEVFSLGSGNWVVMSYDRVDGANPIGDRQTWQDLSGSRNINTSYQNTTGRSIAVSVRTGAEDTEKTFEVSSNGSSWIAIGGSVVGSGSATTRHLSSTGPFIVPSGWYYRVSTSSSSISTWTELR